MNKKVFTTIIILLGLLIPTYIQGEESGWKFEIAPLYLWAINIQGDLGIRGRTASVSIDTSDITDNLEGVFTARINATYNDRINLFFDYNYLDLGKEKVNDLADVDVDVGFTSQFVNFGAGYRVSDSPHNVFVTLGGRYVLVDASVFLNTRNIKLSGDESWIDPTIGINYQYFINDNWDIRVLGDVGGFGVSSDFTWQAGVLIDYQPWKNVAIVAGYRAIGTDYETGGPTDKVVFDTIIHGPLIGLDFRF